MKIDNLVNISIILLIIVVQHLLHSFTHFYEKYFYHHSTLFITLGSLFLSMYLFFHHIYISFLFSTLFRVQFKEADDLLLESLVEGLLPPGALDGTSTTALLARLNPDYTPPSPYMSVQTVCC